MRFQTALFLVVAALALLASLVVSLPVRDAQRRSYLVNTVKVSQQSAPALAEVLSRTSQPESSSGCDCGGEESSEEGSESGCAKESSEASDCCKCKPCDRCNEFDKKAARRQEERPALQKLFVVARNLPMALAPELVTAIQLSDAEEERCKIAKANGQPCLKSFLEEVSCTRFRECLQPECHRLITLCSQGTIQPEVVGDLGSLNTVQPQFVDDVNACPKHKEARCCHEVDDQSCCSQCNTAVVTTTAQ